MQYDDKKATLVVNEAFPKDAGVYVVLAKNIAGEATSSCNVSVKGRLPTETSDSELASDMEPVKPAVQLSLKDVSVFEGQQVRLECIIVGQPEPEVLCRVMSVRSTATVLTLTTQINWHCHLFSTLVFLVCIWTGTHKKLFASRLKQN
jgi:hypothetical protein